MTQLDMKRQKGRRENDIMQERQPERYRALLIRLKEKKELLEKNGRTEKAEERTETFLVETTPPPSPQQQPIQAIQEQDEHGIVRRKIRRNNRRKQNIKIKELEKKLQDAEKSVRKYKKRVRRLKKIKNKKQRPRTYIENLVCGLNVGQEVKKKLLFGEVISTQLKENYKGKRGSIQKRMFFENINGPLIKKYRFTKKKRQVIHQKALQVRRCVKSFPLKDENSRLCPGKRDRVTFRKRKMQKRYLNDSLKNMYGKFRSAHPDIKISYSAFCRMRPFWVLQPKISGKETCLCILHTNMQLIVSKLYYLKIIKEKTLEDLKEINILDHDGDEKTFYEKWVRRKQVLEIKREEKICQRTLKEKICKKSDIVDTLKQGFHGFLLHLRNIVHQYRIIDDMKKNVSTEEILMHPDFSENYSCKYNEEVQSAPYGSTKPQITLHTVVIYYKNPDTAKIEPLSICTLSDSLRHDPPSICAHLQLAIKEIQKIIGTIKTVHFLSDGPSTQYKNKKMFFLMAYFLTRELGVTSLHWHYNESGHGKGAPDGVGAVVKRTADRLVAMGRDIPDLQSLVEALRDSTKVVVLCVNSKHIEEIDRIIPHDLRAFRGTMQVHEVCWTIEAPNILKMRQLSYCREITYDRLRYTDVYSSSDESDDTDDIPFASLREKMSVYFREGMYVVIKLTGKKTVRHYVGVILRNDGGEREDIADVDLSDIQIGLGCPDFNDKTNEYVFSDNLDYPNLY
nr:unnamed protein product [Callosobruchus analis]